MKRVGCSILMLVTLVCIEGCKRSRGGPREAVKVARETDWIYAKRPDVEMKGLIPDPPPPEIPPDPTGKLAEQRQKEAEAKEKAKRLQDTFELGKHFMDFCAKSPVKDQSLDKFKTYLRRAKLDELREQIDSGGMEIQFVSSNTAQHIVAVHKSESDNKYPIYVAGALLADLIPKDALPARLESQELNVVLGLFWDFSKDKYVTTPADPVDGQQLKVALNAASPAAALATISQSPRLARNLKNPPEARSLLLFKRYLKDNARPEVLAAVENNLIRVDVNADLRVGGSLVVAQGKANIAKANHAAINAVGTVSYVPGAVVDAWTKQP